MEEEEEGCHLVRRSYRAGRRMVETVSTAHSPVQRESRCVFANKTLLQERLELSTFAFLSTVLTYKYDALTDCATGAWQPGMPKAGNLSNGHEKGA